MHCVYGRRNLSVGKLILTDIDQTLLNFNRPFETFLRERGMNIPIGSMDGYNNLPDAFPNVTQEETDSLVLEFFSCDMFDNLPPINGSREAVEYLHNEGWEFVGISACPVSVGADRRKANLEKSLGVPFQEVILSGLTECKGNYLRNFDPAVWVEDNASHSNIGHELGHRCYLIDMLHNRGKIARGKRVSNWKEIVDDLCLVN